MGSRKAKVDKLWYRVLGGPVWVRQPCSGGILERMVKGVSRSHFTENKLVLSQFIENKIGISNKMAFLDTNLCNL